MEEVVIKYLYQPSILMELVILLAIFCSFTKPHYLTAIMAALLLLRPNERFECFVSYPKVVYSVLALSLLIYSDKESRIKQLKLDKPLLCFILVIVFQTVLFHSEDLTTNLSFIAVGIMFYYAVVLFSLNSNSARLLSYATVCSCFIICGEAAYYHYIEPMGSLAWDFFHIGPKEAARLQAWGNWGNANETAFIACIGIANSVFLCVRYGTKKLYLTSAALIPFFTLVVFLTGSRAGLATLILVFLPMMFFSDIRGGKMAAVVVIVAALLLSGIFAPQRVDREASSEDRFDLRYVGIQLFKQYPIIGVGFQRASNELGGMKLHNTYLQALVETGVVGAPFLYYFLYLIGARIYRVTQYNKNKQKSNSNSSIVSGLYLGSIFYFLWGNQLLSLLFFFCMAQINTWLQLTEKDTLTGSSSF